jgi:hypothetical protein
MGDYLFNTTGYDIPSIKIMYMQLLLMLLKLLSKTVTYCLGRAVGVSYRNLIGLQ